MYFPIVFLMNALYIVSKDDTGGDGLIRWRSSLWDSLQKSQLKIIKIMNALFYIRIMTELATPQPDISLAFFSLKRYMTMKFFRKHWFTFFTKLSLNIILYNILVEFLVTWSDGSYDKKRSTVIVILNTVCFALNKYCLCYMHNCFIWSVKFLLFNTFYSS